MTDAKQKNITPEVSELALLLEEIALAMGEDGEAMAQMFREISEKGQDESEK